MPMPKAAMDKNTGSIARQDYVRLSRQLAVMQTEPESLGVEGTTDSHLWSGVFGSDPAHERGPLLGSYSVHYAAIIILVLRDWT